MADSAKFTTDSGLTVEARDGNERARRLATFIESKEFTAAQYAAAKAALVAGTASNAQVQLACAVALDAFDVT